MADCACAGWPAARSGGGLAGERDATADFRVLPATLAPAASRQLSRRTARLLPLPAGSPAGSPDRAWLDRVVGPAGRRALGDLGSLSSRSGSVSRPVLLAPAVAPRRLPAPRRGAFLTALLVGRRAGARGSRDFAVELKHRLACGRACACCPAALPGWLQAGLLAPPAAAPAGCRPARTPVLSAGDWWL